MNMENNDLKILNQIMSKRNVENRTYYSYKSSLKNYIQFQGTTFEKLIKEAEKEQKAKISWYDKTIVKRLTAYRKYLYKNFMGTTAAARLNNIIRLYKACNIEMNELPYFNKKNAKYNDPLTWDDLATLNELKEMIDISDPIVPAIFLFMLSSACAKIDTLNVTILDFLKATEPYHKIETYENESEEEIIIEILTKLFKHKKDMIPTFRLKRQKSRKYFTAYCSPEAVKAIVAYLISRTDKLSYNKRLFKINQRYFDDKFKEANNKLARFKTREKKRFTSHMLRRMNASLLYKNNYLDTSEEYKIALEKDQIEALHGRSKGDSIEVAYYKDNPEILRNLYIRALPLITVSHEYTNEELNDIINFESEKKADDKTEAIRKELDEKTKSEKAMKEEINDLKKTQDLILSKLN
ncbi:hypothetical protein [Methanobrevibacter sp.]|uniref:hypothetical protein n=1 Tax=Methanobrevibacter sp. TaxID=66852 RepID=UPI00262EACC7|nr:hypothetical protein [uncultured Methanobrevibacter sp.]